MQFKLLIDIKTIGMLCVVDGSSSKGMYVLSIDEVDRGVFLKETKTQLTSSRVLVREASFPAVDA